MSGDSYKTIRERFLLEMKEKGSRFICHALPAVSREDADTSISTVSKKYYDATHNCFAYNIGWEDSITRFSDDGEPAGTAGKPILNAIRRHELTNIVVIVTRYFGGTKLGTGGLIRAYGGVASATLSQASLQTIYIQDILKLTCSYHHLNAIMSLIEKYSAQIIESRYDESILLRVHVRKKFTDSLSRDIIETTAGQVKPSVVT